jgi:membrane protease YdiL (CAAX protease family)
VTAAERRSAQHRLDRTTPEAHLPPKAEVPGLTGPIVAMIARPIIALAGQTGLALVMRARHRPDPFRRAAGYWMVTSSFADVGCLLVLRASARREGLKFHEVAGFGDHPVRNFRSAWVDVGALVPATVLSQFLDRLLNRGRADPYPAQIRASRTHGWTRAYSLTVWPVFWATTEEATYLGYALPRLERRLGTRAAAAIVATAWAAQHAVIPTLPGTTYARSRVLTMLPVAAAFTAVYLNRGRRLGPLVAAHWASDFSAAVLAAAHGSSGDLNAEHDATRFRERVESPP